MECIPILNQLVVAIPISFLAAAIASLMANAITTDKHIGGSPVPETEIITET